MANFTLVQSNGTEVIVTATTAPAGAQMQAFDETGTSAVLINLAVDGYNIQANGNGQLPAGTGTADKLLGSSSNDLVIWDSALVNGGVAFDTPNGDRHRLDVANSTVAYERIDLGAGNDILNLTYSAATSGGIASPGAYNFAVTAWGNAGNDLLLGAASGDLLFGDAQSDTNVPAPGSDTLFGGAGDDILYGDNGNFSVDAALGQSDTLYGGSGNDTMFGEGGNDSLYDSIGTNTFYGGGGDDVIAAHIADPDLAYGGAGNDLITDATRAYGGGSNDTITLSGGNAGTLFGDGGSDTISASDAGDTVYGGLGNDTVSAGTGSDTLYGDGGVDTLYGGFGSDTIFAGSDLTTVSDSTVTAWDSGIGGDVELTFTAPTGSNINTDQIFGGSDPVVDPDTTDTDLGIQDLLILDMDPNAPLNVFNYSTAAGVVNLTGIEAIVATMGADLINLTSTVGGTHIAYSENISINAGLGDDIVFSGSGNDTIIGDSAALFHTEEVGNDLLAGGAGNDLIYGDFSAAPDDPLGGNDTLFGGLGYDSLFGGAGNDTIGDVDGADVSAGLGADLISVHYSAIGESFLDAGPDGDPGDGNDVVIVSGIFDTVHASLGSGDDLYVSGVVFESGGEGGTSGRLTDIVYGGDGNDAVATYLGDDTLFGGAGNDVLWGGDNDGAGNMLFGGSGTDYLYDTEGSGDQMYGGDGTDYYYWSLWQNGGGGDQIFDLQRTGQAPDGTTNYLVVFGQFNTNETPTEQEPVPDFLANGYGVYQSSHDLVNPLVIDDGETFFSDPIQLIDNTDGTWTLYSEYTNGNVTFDPNDIATIVLWNNDANNPDPFFNSNVGGPVMTFYNWNGETYVYSQTPN